MPMEKLMLSLLAHLPAAQLNKSKGITSRPQARCVHAGRKIGLEGRSLEQ